MSFRLFCESRKVLFLVEGEYAANAAATGGCFKQRLVGLVDNYPCIGEVRGLGLMLGMELVEDRKSRKPAADLCAKILKTAWQNGLLLLSCGASTIRFMPPLSVTREQVDKAMDILRRSLDQALQ